MVSYDYSGRDVVKAMVNSSVSWVPERQTGSHMILKWEPPDDHRESEPRTVSIPNHNSIPRGTLKGISEDAGADDLDKFCMWIESNL
ncbi:type II toxin-antitoxin system HicA family toxin [Halapricum hydrolyticum]|uniref:Type II toxin-antitoxin system HicA family toxin n=1 Tax=Halapricum hydrolyticum TaxID=2979991 RepID=A0AAE3I8W6_9EURY|nr:type II toxin-antitoxin system HicA family toxin [Halapricum hydrolyticum]MCU4716879.1 type II toxin-antitoxin system HicA family toxin [Halapricum hydrolyticum]MCU4725516.1 type II toxin-antitoxin system HicA family toxin [Halapricum hydrolyticum]